jgi:hypothetical protein
MTTKAETIQKHALDLANAWIAKDAAEQTINETIIAFIKPRTMTETGIDDYLKFFGDALVKAGKNEKTVGVYKSNVKRILKLAINHKDEVIKLGKNAGNLNQWYNACGDNKPAERNKNPKVTNKPTPTEQPKLGADEKKPSGGRDFVTEFKTVAQEMLAGGMTAEQLHAMIEELTVAKAA